MRVRGTIIALAAIFVPTGIANADQIFKATLSGDQEVPPVDTQATGKVKLRVNDDVSAVEFTLTVNDGVRVQQSHIHCGAAGTNGPVVVWLAGLRTEGWDIDGEWVSNVTFTAANIVDPSCGATLADLVQSMQAGMTYANVHTVAHPGGEIRGQIPGTASAAKKSAK
jgi:CHRD domain-containing protein